MCIIHVDSPFCLSVAQGQRNVMWISEKRGKPEEQTKKALHNWRKCTWKRTWKSDILRKRRTHVLILGVYDGRRIQESNYQYGKGN